MLSAAATVFFASKSPIQANSRILLCVRVRVARDGALGAKMSPGLYPTIDDERPTW